MITEKAKSKSQQRYMAMVAHGKIKGPKGLSRKQARKFAKTKHKGLPEHVKESEMGFINFLILEADGDGNKKEPMKKAMKDKKSVKEANMGDYFPNAADEFDHQPVERECEECDGRGGYNGRTCKSCHGEGVVYENIHHKNAAPFLDRSKREDSLKSKSSGAKRHGDAHVVSGTSNRSKTGDYLRMRNRADESKQSFAQYLLSEISSES